MKLSEAKVRRYGRLIAALLLFAAAAMTGCNSQESSECGSAMPRLFGARVEGAEAGTAIGMRGGETSSFRHHVRVAEPGGTARHAVHQGL